MDSVRVSLLFTAIPGESQPSDTIICPYPATEITLRDVGAHRSEGDAIVSRYPRCVASFANGAKHLASQYRLSTRCLSSNGWCRDPAGRVGLINRRTPESYTVPQPLGTCGWSHADQPVRKSIPAINPNPDPNSDPNPNTNDDATIRGASQYQRA